MNSGRSDAATSTDDVPSRPLCLFYFTHPFGVLSPEPPTLAAAPAHIARAFVNMQPVAPGAWGPPPACDPPGGPARPEYELGRATVHAAPVDVLRVARARRCTLGLAARRESLSSSLFSGDVWFDSGSSGRSDEYARRLIPLNRILPPLRLPSPRDSSTLDSSDDLWPKKCLNPEKFSLPPIELPTENVKIVRSEKCIRSGQADEAGGGGGARAGRVRHRVGVAKPRRAARPHELRRMLAALTRRTVAGGTGRGASPALRDALSTIREAWAEPRSLRARSRAVRREPAARAMERAEARRDASPGLLRRRYSVPETIMRKYRLAQLRSDPEESVPATSRSAASASPPPDAARPGRAAWRDREPMRRSALLRRAWGRADCRGCCCCRDERAPGAGRETRSLDGSRSELRHSPGGLAGLAGLAGWATPKRQRLESRDFRGSDEMLRAAMRNSYDRAEETRDRAVRTDLSDSTYRSHADHPDMIMDAFTDSDMSKCDERPETLGRDVFTLYSERQSSETTTVEIKSTDDTCMTGHTSPVQRNEQHISDERSLSDSSDTFSPSLCTAKETLDVGRPLAVLTRDEHVKESTGQHAEDIYNVGHNLLPYRMPLTVGTAPSYEVLEIVVSETLNTDPVPAIRAPAHDDKPRPSALRTPPHSQRSVQNINIDEYVSNILVESLNSLTDQLECMSASIGSNRKISVVEKEIKIKLQNTGVNTIVHLSPTSNNPIIFGNEELFNEDSRRDACNNALTIREEVHSVESNNNEVSSAAPDSGAPCPCDSFDIRHDHVNQAVLQQIQKLFQDELNGIAPADYPTGMPEISHIEISDVDTFIDNAEAELAAQDEQSSANLDPCQYEVIGGIGTCNYYPDVGSHPVVPRFSALPHTDSMEVNTSSSEDADIIGSECTSLVDSLDDPNSPRSVLLRRAYSGRRSELVRSAIDVLDLLPENICTDNTPREKPESFFIGIKDNECDCDKENVNVADRMPEKIKQRLYRRHRKRELRMECARRSRSRQRAGPRRARRDVERDCIAIVNALIDDVIAKIAQDEYKCMRIKNRPTKMLSAKSDDNVTKRTWRKDLEPINDRVPFKAIKNGCVRFDTKERRAIEKNEQHQIHGKLSLRSPPATDNRTAKRIYQKSEIHEGNKCIEILEILEYVNGSQSSPENTNSDENQNHCTKNKKSRIPVPIVERSQKSPNGESQKNNNRRWSGERRGTERNDNTNRLITDMLLEALAEQERAPPPRRASVPAAREPREPRERANSLRFRQVFDIIPEERSSLSLDSGTEDLSYNRRASAPDIVEEYHIDEPSERECDDVPPPISPLRAERSTNNDDRQRVRRPSVSEIHRKYKETKSAATSPMSDIDADKHGVRSRHQTTMTSPSCKSAATSPLRSGAPGRARAGPASPRRATEGVNEKNAQPDESPARHSATTACPSQSERKEPRERPRRDVRADRQPARRQTLARSQSHEQVSPNAHVAVDTAPSPGEPRRKDHFKSNQKRNSRTLSLERSEEETIHSVKLPEFKGGGGVEGAVGASSSDSSESGGSLLCPLAPRWLAPGRARRGSRRRATAPPAPAPPAPAAPVAGSSDSPAPHHQARDETGAGAWSVTVAGSCRAALPHDVEMRLRFPHERDAQAHATPGPCQVAECPCRHCARCACARGSPGPRAPPLPAARADGKLTLTMKKEALDSSILASKSSRKSSAQLPDVETYRASRSRLKSSVKTRRGYSLHCWLPDSENAPIRARDGLSVLGCAIVPELKPRVRTMSERDLTRVYTPRLYLRS